MLFRGLDRYRDLGLLLMRIGLGVMFMMHGLPKLTAGPEMWVQLGAATSNFGITFAPTMFGFLAAATETFGGLMLALGLLFRPALILLTVTMVVAAAMHLGKGDGLMGASHAIEAGIVFASLILIGPGRHSIDSRMR